jgi:hypothetical protein
MESNRFKSSHKPRLVIISITYVISVRVRRYFEFSAAASGEDHRNNDLREPCGEVR